MDWNFLIAIGIILIIILIIAAKVTGQTIGELLSDLKEFFIERGEKPVELVTQVYD